VCGHDQEIPPRGPDVLVQLIHHSAHLHVRRDGYVAAGQCHPVHELGLVSGGMPHGQVQSFLLRQVLPMT
jgi:hypothetical protein